MTFAANAAVELPPREAFPLEGGSIILNSRISPDATNIEQSLSLAAAMLPEDTRGRIVLISDGAETAGNLKRSSMTSNAAASRSMSCRSPTATTKRSGSSGLSCPSAFSSTSGTMPQS